MTTSPGLRLRRAFAKQAIAVPGVFDALVARMAERLGFSAIYLSGAALSAGAGLPDVGLLSVTEFVDHLHEHFVHPVIIRKGRYLAPTAAGYSSEIFEGSRRARTIAALVPERSYNGPSRSTHSNRRGHPSLSLAGHLPRLGARCKLVPR